jgi:hypothetical protein
MAGRTSSRTPANVCSETIGPRAYLAASLDKAEKWLGEAAVATRPTTGEQGETRLRGERIRSSEQTDLAVAMCK